MTKKTAAELIREDADDEWVAHTSQWREEAVEVMEAQMDRIAELEANLIAEAKKTASEKTRADQMTEQHRMQAKMHSEAREDVAQLRQQMTNSQDTADRLEKQGWKRVMCPGCGGDYALSSPDAIPSNSAELGPSTPWYPDDSGEWVEVPEDLMEMPAELSPETIIVGLINYYRHKKLHTDFAGRAKSWMWAISPGLDGRIVAYKVVKP